MSVKKIVLVFDGNKIINLCNNNHQFQSLYVGNTSKLTTMFSKTMYIVIFYKFKLRFS